MKTIICAFCGTTIKSLAQAKEPCEERPYTKFAHSIRPDDRAYLEKRAAKSVNDKQSVGA